MHVAHRASPAVILGRPMDGPADAEIGPAPADVAGHAVVDVGVGRSGVLPEQDGRGHDLPRLAVAALGHVFSIQACWSGRRISSASPSIVVTSLPARAPPA